MSIDRARRIASCAALVAAALAVSGCSSRGGTPTQDGKATVPTAADELGIPAMEALTQYQNGGGVVVCAASPANGAEDRDFATGVAGWLQYAIGSQGELGKTPLWSSYVSTVLTAAPPAGPAPDPERIISLHRRLGITHVVTGSLSGSGDTQRLALYLWTAPARERVGAAITLEGSRDRILRALAGAAEELSRRVGVAAPRVDALAESAREVQQFGALLREPREEDPRRALLVSARLPAPRSHFGQALAVAAAGRAHSREILPRVRELLNAAPDQVLAWGIAVDAAGAASSTLDPVIFRPRLNAVLQRYPHNYVLREVDGFVWSSARIYSEATASEAEAVRCATRNPIAWRNLADSVSAQGELVRQSRVAAEIGADEWAVIRPIYGRWMEAAKRAVDLNPGEPRAWNELSVAAAFHGDWKLADHAYQHALATAGGDRRVLWWGLELYADKWLGNRRRLNEVAQLAARSTSARPADRLQYAQSLHNSGRDDLAKQVLGSSGSPALLARWAAETRAVARQGAAAGLDAPQSDEAATAPAASAAGRPAAAPVAAPAAASERPASSAPNSAFSASTVESTTPPHHRGALFALAWAPSGEILASGAHDGLRLWYPDRRQLVALPPAGGSVYAIAWSPDSRRLAFGCSDGTVRLWSVSAPAPHRVLRAHAGPVRSLAWSRDGLHLASGGDDAVIRVWDTASGRRERELRGHQGPVGFLEYSPATGELLSTAYQPGSGKVRLWDGSGGLLREIPSSVTVLNAAAWKPDGVQVAVAEPTSIGLWNTRSGRKEATLGENQFYVLGLAWSADGQNLLAARGDRKLHLLNARTGDDRPSDAAQTQALFVAWRPHSDQLAVGRADGTVELHQSGEWTGRPAANPAR